MLVCRHITKKSKNKNSYRASGSSVHACVYVCAGGGDGKTEQVFYLPDSRTKRGKERLSSSFYIPGQRHLADILVEQVGAMLTSSIFIGYRNFGITFIPVLVH